MISKMGILILFMLSGMFLAIYPSSLVTAQICVSNNPNDLDGDSIPNEWELNGMDVNNDNKTDLNLPALGASPVHKDLFLEIDYMKYHRPYPGIEDNVIRSFEDTLSDSACNPDGTKGINLHLDIDEEIPHQDSITVFEQINGTWKDTWSGFDDIKDAYFGNSTQRSSDNSDSTLDAKRQLYHYAVFAHTFNNQPNSGISRGIPGMDFIISLGHNSWPPGRVSVNQLHNVGSPALQEGTLMHEFGHNLGLSHGGGDHINNKPNYFSVMNYELQMPIKIDNRRLDFSQCVITPINETNLIERTGIGESCPPELLMFIDCPPNLRSIYSAGWPIDWNLDGDIQDTNITADINCDNNLTSLNGYDDWGHLTYITNVGQSPPDDDLGTQGNMSVSEIDLNMTQIYNNTALGQQFEEMTYEDIQQQLTDKVDAAFNEINKTQQGISLDTALSALAGEPSGRIPEESSLDDVKKAYGLVLGTGNFSSLVNDTSLGGNTTKELILSDNIDAAINSTENVLSTMDSTKGGSPVDDLIKNPSDQLRVGRILESIVDSLKAVSCSHTECIVNNQTGVR